MGSLCCPHRRVVSGKAGERWQLGMQAWQVLIKTVVDSGNQLWGCLRQEEEKKTLDLGCLKRSRRQVPQGAWGLEQCKGKLWELVLLQMTILWRSGLFPSWA